MQGGEAAGAGGDGVSADVDACPLGQVAIEVGVGPEGEVFEAGLGEGEGFGAVQPGRGRGQAVQGAFAGAQPGGQAGEIGRGFGGGFAGGAFGQFDGRIDAGMAGDAHAADGLAEGQGVGARLELVDAVGDAAAAQQSGEGRPGAVAERGDQADAADDDPAAGGGWRWRRGHGEAAGRLSGSPRGGIGVKYGWFPDGRRVLPTALR